MTPISITAVSAADLREQVDRICRSKRFAASPQLSQLLRYLVRETGAGRGKRLKQYVIATEVLGRPDSFDPVADPIVRVTMGRLRKLLDAYYADEGSHELARIEIPVGSYNPRLLVESAPVDAVTPGRATGALASPAAPARQPFLLWMVLGVVVINFLLLQYLLAKL
jgi:hypothetical protein